MDWTDKTEEKGHYGIAETSELIHIHLHVVKYTMATWTDEKAHGVRWVQYCDRTLGTVTVIVVWQNFAARCYCYKKLYAKKRAKQKISYNK